MRLLCLRAAAAVLPLVATLPTVAAGDAARGQLVYERLCSGCHAMDVNRYGPAHRGVFGRKAGTAADYVYSGALAASTIVWSEATLDKWLTDPEKLVPGQKMSFSVPNAVEREDVIAYLKSQAKK
jgi:cytochrome c